MESKHEQLRLQALRETQLLDSSPDARFDRITRLAQRVFSVPIALFSLVDNRRQWFKSKQGLDVCETPKEHTFCKFAVARDATLIVEDAKQHPDFTDNPLVTGEPHIRFYAGVPIHAPEGYAIGTLCIIDTRPRKLSDDELNYLGDLAFSIERMLAADGMQYQIDELRALKSEAAYQARLNQVKAEIALQTQTEQLSLENKLQVAVTACCNVLGADIASIWLRESDNAARCLGEYRAAGHEFLSDAVLDIKPHQTYWQHLIKHGELVANEVDKHDVLTTLMPDYLAPNNVHSLIDVLITDEPGCHGCLCIESRSRLRTWSATEISFVHDMARLITTLLAVSRQEKAAAESAELAATLGAVMEAAVDVAIIATDEKGLIRIFNSGAQSMLGYRDNEVVNKETPLLFHDLAELSRLCEELVIPVDNLRSFDFFQYAVSSPTLSHHHWNYKRKDGRILKVLLKLSAIHDQAGNVSGYLGIASDITDELAAQRDSKIQESRLRALFELSPVGIALNDFATGKFLDGNQKLIKPTGYSEAEFKSLSYYDLTPSEYSEKEAEMLTMLSTTSRYGPFEKEYIRKDGTRYPVLLNGVLVEDVEGRKLIWSIIEDISERKHLEELKSQFISTVSHELRTPLTSITGALSLLLSGRLGEIGSKAQSMLTIANNNSKRLVTLINELLDFEKLTSGRMQLELSSLELLPLIKTAVNDNSTYATEKNINISLNTDAFSRNDTRIQVDEQRFHQIMSNLLSNAIKFSPAASTINISVVDQEDTVRVMVSDHGSGIPDDFKARIFKRFQQAKGSDRRAASGTGLGLAITKELVEAMGGQIDFVSTHGEGSCFYFDLPAVHSDTNVSSVQSTSAKSIIGPKRNTLVVEDDPGACEVLAEIYIQNGFNVQTAHSVQEARRFITSDLFMLISLDLKLPDGNGLDFLHEIRASKLNAKSKVIIISGEQVSSTSRKNYRSAQLDWLLKPVSDSALTETISRMAGNRQAFSVLHVEDDTDLNRIVNSMLGDNFTVTHANTLGKAQQLIDSSDFDAVLLDIGLPDGNGADLVPAIRSKSPSAAIIILSGQDLSDSTSLKIQESLLKTSLPSVDLQEMLRRAIGQMKGSGH
jgi:PAS domain S-box-containing protein